MALIRYDNDLWRDSFTDLDRMFQRMFGARGSNPFSTMNRSRGQDLEPIYLPMKTAIK